MKNLLERVLNTYLKVHMKTKVISQCQNEVRYHKYWEDTWRSRQELVRVLDADLTLHSATKVFDNAVHRIYFYKLVILDDDSSQVHVTTPYLNHYYHLAIVVPWHVLVFGNLAVPNYVSKKRLQFEQQVFSMQITPDSYTVC